jgi:F0F1-type ATP synthase assembly protein I
LPGNGAQHGRWHGVRYIPGTFPARNLPMSWLVTKYLVTAAVVVLVSEAARRSDKLGGLVAALPLVTVLVLVWLHVERQPEQKIANHAWYTFWYVLPTLPMFLAFPWLLARFGFWPALLASALITVACFWLFAQAVRPFGIELL